MTHTPIKSPKGKWIHAVAMMGDSIGRTLCRLKCDGWSVVDAAINCPTCIARGAK